MANELQTKLDAILLDKNTNLLPENLKAGVNCLGVTGTYEGSGGGTVEGVKQFSTIEQMQADPNAQEGDLAVVYRNEMQNATADSRFQTATFPDTVVLDTAITDYVDVRYRAVDSSVGFDCMGQLDNSNFMMDCYTETGNIRIQYTSSDGITYTRTDTTGNPVDFGTEIYYERAERWNDAIGKFIQIGGSTFEGLYIYDSTLVNKTTSSYYKVNDIENKGANITIVGYVDVKRLYDFIISHKDQLSDYVTNFAGMAGVLLINNDGTYTLYSSVASSGNTILGVMVPSIVNNVHGLLDIRYQYDINKVLKIDIDYGNDNITVTDMSSQLVKYSYTDTASGGKWYLAYLPLEYYGLNMCNMDASINSNTYKTYITCRKSSYTTGSISTEYLYTIEGTFLPTPMYTIAPTQLTVTPEYVYEKEFYGKNGLEIGTLTDVENLPLAEVVTKTEIFSLLSNIVCPASMYYAFKESQLEHIDISNLDFSNTTNMGFMFYGCSNLKSVNFGTMELSNVTSIDCLFGRCTSLETIDLTPLTGCSPTNGYGLFSDCTLLKRIDLSPIDLSKLTSITHMLMNCVNLEFADLSSIDFGGKNPSREFFMTDVPDTCEILVKDQASKDWFSNYMSRFTNVKIKS